MSDEPPITMPAPTSAGGVGVTPGAGRLTALLNVHVEHHGEDPDTMACRVCRPTVDNSQLYGPRRFTVKLGKPMPLDLGWVDVPGLVVLENRTGIRLQNIPTPEEQADLNSRTLLVRNGTATLEVPPGLFIMVQFGNPGDWTLEAVSGDVLVAIAVAPRTA